MTLSHSGVRASYSFAWSFVFALNWTPPFSPGARIEYAVPPAKSIRGGAAPAMPASSAAAQTVSR